MKKDVDNYKIGKWLPACMLKAHAPGVNSVSDLEIRIDLKGASEDRNYFEVHVQAQGDYKN